MSLPIRTRGRRGWRFALFAAVLLAAVAAAAGARAGDANRGGVYLRLGVGPFSVFSDADAAPLAELENPSGEALGSFALGLDLNRRWSVEVAGELMETILRNPNVGAFAELAIWTLLGQVRYRVPLRNNAVVPYFGLGGGVGWSEYNDRKIPTSEFPSNGAKESSFVGSAVAGLDLYFNPHVALSLEVKYLFAFTSETVRINDVPQELTLDSMIPTAGLRVYF